MELLSTLTNQDFMRVPNDNPIFYRSAVHIAGAIRERHVSALEMVETHLSRIEAVNPKLNAVVTLCAERAIDEANKADHALSQGQAQGILHGVPITIKDSIETAGIRTTGGTEGLTNHVPERDASVVAALRGAGAIIVGKTNTPELTLSGETDNNIFGRTNNPYNLERSPGGSSGGAAAILAAGGSALDLGSDVGGSIREPAHYCGIVGIKPTSGRLPGSGHIPASYGVLSSFGQIGPMARWIEDLVLVLPLLCQVDWSDPSVVPMPVGSPDAVKLGKLRVATYVDNGVMTPHDDIAHVVNEAARVIAATSATVVTAVPEAIPEAIQIVPRLRDAEGGAPVRKALALAGTKNPAPSLAYALDLPPALPGDVLSGLLDELNDIRRRMLGFMQDYDAIICPVSPWTARVHGFDPGEDRYNAWSHSMAFNLTGWPGVTVPAGTGSDGLPIGVQVVARPWREDVALALAGQIESAFGGFSPPPESVCVE